MLFNVVPVVLVNGILMAHLHDFLQLEGLIRRLQHFAADRRFLIRRISRSFYEDIALRVATH